MRLGDFLKRELSNGGPWHCSTLAADWCVALGYPDFAAAWRHLTIPAECDAVVAAAGGLAVLWNQGIGSALPVVGNCAGVQVRTAELEMGDIAVIAALGAEAGAVWTGKRWALRRDRGLHFMADSARIVIRKAWRP